MAAFFCPQQPETKKSQKAFRDFLPTKLRAPWRGIRLRKVLWRTSWPQERREMEHAITELARVIDRLAAAVESLKEGEKESPPLTPLKEKGKKNTHIARARGVVFTVPTPDECRAYAAAANLAIDVAHFHDHYTSNGWKISGRAPMKDWRAAMRNWARCEKSVRPLTAYERKRAEFEFQVEAVAARKEQLRKAAIAALTAGDWALCREAGCRNRHADGGCRASVALPPDHRLNSRPCRPEECPRFAAKEGISPERSESRKRPLGGCAA